MSDDDLVADRDPAGFDDARPDPEGQRLRRLEIAAVARERGKSVEVRATAVWIERRHGAAPDVPHGHHDRVADLDALLEPGVLRVCGHIGDAEEHPKAAWIDRPVARDLGHPIQRCHGEKRRGAPVACAVDAAPDVIETNEPTDSAVERRQRGRERTDHLVAGLLALRRRHGKGRAELDRAADAPPIGHVQDELPHVVVELGAHGDERGDALLVETMSLLVDDAEATVLLDARRADHDRVARLDAQRLDRSDVDPRDAAAHLRALYARWPGRRAVRRSGILPSRTSRAGRDSWRRP